MDICFDYYGDPLLLCFFISGKSTNDNYDYYVILNGNSTNTNEQILPGGAWEVLVNDAIASPQTIDVISGTSSIPPKSGLFLRKLRH